MAARNGGFPPLPVAESAGVTEYLLFRHFGSKAGLFREALVLPFTDIVDDFGRTWRELIPEETDEDELARHFVEQVYDVVVEHRGLLLTLVASEAFSEEEIADAGIADIRRALAVLSQISVEGMQLRGLRSNQPDMPAHSTMAMIVVDRDILRNQATLARRDRRRTRAGDTSRFPAPR